MDAHHLLPELTQEIDHLLSTERERAPQRQLLECIEWEALEITAEQLIVGNHLQLYEEVQGSKYLSVHFRGTEVVFTATHWVGHIPLNDRIALNVLPRFDISNLTRLLRIARHSPVPLERFVREYSVHREHLESIFDQLAASFVQAVEVVTRSGLLTTYEARSEDTAFPKGRILVGGTLRRHHARGSKFRAEAQWFERTYDNGPNRLLKYTLWLLEQRLASTTQRRGVARLRTQLNRFYRAFRNVRLDRTRGFLSDPLATDPSRLPVARAYYARALQLGLLLIRDEGVDFNRVHGLIEAPSMLVDLQTGFEAYVRNVLSEELNQAESGLDVLDGNLQEPAGGQKYLFDDSTDHAATPDIVIRSSDQALDDPGALMILEVKYKPAPSRQDLNQTITYGLAYRAPIVVLVHVREDDAPRLKLEGRIGGMEVYRMAVELSGNLEQEEQLVSQMLGRLSRRAAERSGGGAGAAA